VRRKDDLDAAAAAVVVDDSLSTTRRTYKLDYHEDLLEYDA
jgi:hypothetical protein